MSEAMVLHGVRDIRLETQPDPPLAADEVRVRFAAGGICGSDIHYYLDGASGDFRLAEPLILGHEIAGLVAETGSAVDRVAVGDPVALYPARTCGICAACQAGRENLCPETFFFGSASRRPHMQGGFRRLIRVRQDQCYPQPPNLDPALSAFAEPLAVCLHAVDRAGATVADARVLVIGAGPIGQLLVLAARRAGAGFVAVSDLLAEPLILARRLGADLALDAADPAPLDRLSADGIDVVLEASGTQAGAATALHLVRRGGTVVQVGNLPGGDTALPVYRLGRKEIDWKGSMRFTRAAFERSVDAIVTGGVDVAPLLSHRIPLPQAGEAIELAADRRRAMKVVLVGDEG